MNKKGAIELSVTAIVILILAIVILGLGLGFIRGMFTRVSTTFEQQIAAEPEPPTPSGADPITLSRETIITHAGDTEVLKISVYNPTSQDWSVTNHNISMGCNSLTLENTQVNMRTLGQGESDTFNFLFTIPRTTSESTYLCQGYVRNSSTTNYKLYMKDLTIKITR